MSGIREWLLIFGLLVLASIPSWAEDRAAPGETLRVLSWNVSDDAFLEEPKAFRSLLRWADPDVVLLDEVSPLATPEDLADDLAAIGRENAKPWNISLGQSGGRQRCVIASRAPLEPVPGLSSQVSYPAEEVQRIRERMPEQARSDPRRRMDQGIPVNGAIIQAGTRRLLVVVADLQCCGDGPESWQEYRRRVEARTLRQRIAETLAQHPVDGIVFAGDFNMVNSTFPMGLLAGPYPPPHSGLIAAELYHPDSISTWTWDGRGTPFPSNVLDYQLYGPRGLRLRGGFILDPEGVSAETRHRFGLDADSAARIGRHRPLLAEYDWVD